MELRLILFLSPVLSCQLQTFYGTLVKPKYKSRAPEIHHSSWVKIALHLFLIEKKVDFITLDIVVIFLLYTQKQTRRHNQIISILHQDDL